MTDSILIEFDGLEPLIKKLELLGKLDFMGAALLAGAEHLKGVAAVYPKATIANSPANPSGRWYERGYGPKWKTADGEIMGRKTSEFLGRKWTARKVNNFLSTVGNNVSYAPAVMDRDYQKTYHAAHGWITIQQIAEEEREYIIQAVIKALREALK